MKHRQYRYSKIYTTAAALLALVSVCCVPAFGQTKSLDDYISRGLANSPLLRDYQNQVTANSIDSQRLRATYRPQVSGISNNTYAPLLNSGYGYDPVLSNIASVNALLNVNQSFAGRASLRAQYLGIRLATDSVSSAKYISEQDLKRTIIAQYITAYGDQQQVQFNTEINDILSNQESILKKLTQNNIYRQTDYLTFLVTFRQQELQLKQLRIQLHTDIATLNYLCGIYDTSGTTLSAPTVMLQDLPDAASSVFFIHYRTDSLLLQNEITLLNYSYRPRLSAFANGGYSSSFLYQAYKNFGFSVGLNLNVPIYDGHQRKLQTQKIKLLDDTRQGYRNFFTSQYSQQVAMLSSQLHETEALISDIGEQIKYSEGLIKVNGQLLETGDARISDFIIAINNFLNAKNLLTQNNISRMQIINQLNYWNR